MLSISLGNVVHEYPLKSLNGSTVLMLFPVLIKFDNVLLTRK